MSNLIRKAAILALAESIYGTDAVPTTANGILASVPDVGISGDKIERDFTRETLSPLGHVIGVKRQTLNFSTELKGANDSADPDKATHFDCLLKACGMQPFKVTRLPISGVTGTFEVGETVTGGTSTETATVVRVSADRLDVRDESGAFSAAEAITGGSSGATATAGSDPMDDHTSEYRPVSDESSFDSVTLYYYADTIRHRMLGCRGNVDMEFPVGVYPKLNFKFTGFWTDPTDQTHPADVTFEEHVPPQCVAAGLVFDAYSPVGVNAISLDVGNDVQESKDINADDGISEIFIPSRSPSGSVDPDVVALSAFNPFTSWQNAAKLDIRWMVGTDLGNKIFVQVPYAQIGEMGYQDRNGRRAYNLPIVPTGDDNEICLQIG